MKKKAHTFRQPRPLGFSLKKLGAAGKGPGIGWSRAQPKYS